MRVKAILAGSTCLVCALLGSGQVLSQNSQFVKKGERLIDTPDCFDPRNRTTCSDEERRDWLTSIRNWRTLRQQYIALSPKRYDDPKTAWAATSFIQTQLEVEDRFLYDPVNRRYTVDRYLDDVKKRFGGVDSVLIWPFYPNAGVDSRNQMDVIRSMPGGIAGVRGMVADFHRRGVRVLFPMMMWDQGTRKPDKAWPDEIADVMKGIGADGVNGDTSDGVPPGFNDAADRAGIPLVFEPELAFDDALLGNNLMSWGYYQYGFVPRVDRDKWLVRRHLVNVNQRWSHDRVDQVHYAFFNGVGYEPWEQVWGVWNGITPRDGELIRRFATLTRGVAPYLQSEDWEPYFPTVQSGVFASYWPSAGSAVWTLVNRNAFPLEGSMLSVPAVPGMRYFDLYHGEELIPRAAGDKVTLSFPIDGRGIGAVLATPGRADAGMTVLMATMRLLTAQPLDAFDDRWKPLAQALLQPAATKRYASAPEGMVAVPTARFEFAVQGVEIEDDNGYVDVQYPWEDQPRRSHRHVLDIPAFFIDRYPVSNGEFKRFVVSTSYTPKDSGNFLKGWADTEFPSGAENKPVTWVSQDDARAYCTWAGKRLPREWEWQYSAQGTDGRIYPWGNDWQADRVPTPDTGHEPRLPDDRNAHPNGASPFGVEDLVGNVWQWTDEFQDRHTRAAILRGGSLYKPQGSYWYFPQAYRNDQHGKLLLMAPSKDRSSMIGFRCAADSAR